MPRSTSNPTSALVLTVTAGLLLPALLLGAWVWLVLGGAIDQHRADEIREAESVARTLTTDWQAALREAANQRGPGRIELRLDPTGLPVAPFQPWPQVASDNGLPESADVVLTMALREEARGQHPDALRYFEHAGREAVLSHPAATLAMARSLAASGRSREARELLADASPGSGGTPLSYRLLIRLLDARIAPDQKDTEPARRLAREVITGSVPLPAEAAAPVAEMLRGWVPDLDVHQLDAFQAAAAAFVSLRGQRRALVAPAPGPSRSILVPLPGKIVLLGAGVVEAVQRRLLERQREKEPRFEVSTHETPPENALASAVLPPLPAVVGVVAQGRLTSTLLRDLATLLLILAIVAFVVGNLLAIRMVRRERVLSRLRSNFVDMVSHELRTPLAALSLKAEMLASDEVPQAKRSDYIQSLHAEVQRLVERTRGILDFARLQRGAPALAIRSVSLREVLARCVRDCRALLRTSRHHLDIEVARNLPELEADPDILVTAIRNLVENAAKYSPAESTIQLGARAVNGRIQITVSDRGPGIPEHERERIFEPFRRGEDAESKGAPGTGLGLAIVDRAVRAHRGRVVVGDHPEGGAVFQLELPSRQERRPA